MHRGRTNIAISFINYNNNEEHSDQLSISSITTAMDTFKQKNVGQNKINYKTPPIFIEVAIGFICMRLMCY
jgi:hypothetical protein